jgi:hypothetical protein
MRGGCAVETQVKEDQTREACECWEDEKNGLVSDNAALDAGQ